MAIAILKKAGYRSVASSNKKEQYEYLTDIGAAACVPRSETDDVSGKPILRTKWAGAIDNVGGNTLHTLLKACAKEGSVASIGLVQSPKIEMTVYPFILNGVNLLGVDSAEIGMEVRTMIWNKLASEWKPDNLQLSERIVSLEEIPDLMDEMLKGKTHGRIVAQLI
jgi:putative YhdH/YhfP family quinone oxidoreductase